MQVRDQTIPATDGFALSATVFEGSNRHWTVINSATGVKRAYYHKFAAFLAKQGWSVVIYDYRGIGGSRPDSLKGFAAQMRDWGQKDFNGVLRWVEEQRPERLAVVGHSVGGQVLAFAEEPQRIERVLAVASQSGHWRHWSFPRKYFLAFLWYLMMPVLSRLMGYFPSRRLGLGEDLPRGVALEWAQWCRHRCYYLGQKHRLDFPGLKCSSPILAYSFSDDPFCPPAAAQAYLRWFSLAPSEQRHLRPSDLDVDELGHFCFFRSDFRESLWREGAQWLGEGVHAEAQRHRGGK
jgi:predicted alpha/beta hydrolase